jgi:ribokinase
MTRIVVLGSVNLDLVVPVERQPRPGETLIGGDRAYADGGKGGNQAVAAARLGADVAFVGRVGDDPEGERLRAALVEEGIDVSRLVTDERAPTGMALITVDPEGENAIVVSPGANGRVAAADVRAARELIAGADVLVLQHEVPAGAVEAAVDAAANAGVRVILNPAPARAVPALTLAKVAVLVPNRSELGVLCGAEEPTSVDAAGALAATLSGPAAVVVTLGEEGALIVEAGERTLVEAPGAEPVDTTGAGDTFCGALAVALGEGELLADAVRFAVRAAALSVRAAGARAGMPRRAELES